MARLCTMFIFSKDWKYIFKTGVTKCRRTHVVFNGHSICRSYCPSAALLLINMPRFLNYSTYYIKHVGIHKTFSWRICICQSVNLLVNVTLFYQIFSCTVSLPNSSNLIDEGGLIYSLIAKELISNSGETWYINKYYHYYYIII